MHVRTCLQISEILPNEPGIFSHRIEDGVLVTEKVTRRIKLYNTASVKDHDATNTMVCVNWNTSILKHVTTPPLYYNSVCN